MAWNVIRRATAEDEERLERAARRFIDRHSLVNDIDMSNPVGELEDLLDYSIRNEFPLRSGEAQRLSRNWRRCVRRALRDPNAEGIAYGNVGYNV